MTTKKMVEKTNDSEALRLQLERVSRHYSAGRFQAAVDLSYEIDSKLGATAETMHIRGLALYANGEQDAGFAMLQEAASFMPENGAIQADIGALLAQKGQFDDALEHLNSAVELAPHYAAGWSNLGGLHFKRGDYDAAIGPLRKAVHLDPNLLDAHRNLGTAWMQRNRYKQAVASFYQALSIDPNDPALHLSLSGALFRAERHDTALYHAEKALELAPGLLQAHLHLGNAKAAQGKMEEAEEHLLKASSRMPAGFAALARLIHIRKTTEDSPEFKRLQRVLQLKDKAIGQRQMRSMHFAAGKAFADLKDYKVSFDHFMAGNELTAAENSADLQNHKEQIERFRTVFTPDAITRLKDTSYAKNKAPIFVCGMARSGTTLTELMLSRHSKVQAGGELNAAIRAFSSTQDLVELLEDKVKRDVTADEISRLGEAYLEAVQMEGLNGEIVTDKLPINYMHIGALSLALPRAKFVVMRRHPLDCCLSNWCQDFGRNQPFSTSFENIGQVYMEYHKITDHWAKLLPDAVHILQYEDLVTDPELNLREVLEFCGLEWEDAVLDPAASTRAVNTASIAQVRQPVNQDAKAKWRRYGPLLKPLAEEVAELLSESDREAVGL